MKLKDVHTVFFVGIGGIGMSALARYFINEGKVVLGYDRNYSKITNDLEEDGVPIIYNDEVTSILPRPDLIIRTPAVPTHSNLLAYFNSENIPIKKRAEILGLITRESQSIGIAGTHGKTSVSTLIAHILTHSHKKCNAFLGGISNNYQSNFIYDKDAHLTVVEADEFDRSFLHLHPKFALLTSTDTDHLDIYANEDDLKKTYSQYLNNTLLGGAVFYKKGLDIQLPTHVPSFSYSTDEFADYFASNITHVDGKAVFNLNYNKQRIEEITLPFPGRHNVENATGASAIALHLGVTPEQLKTALGSFQGIERRFNFVLNHQNIIYIDDYAHHPAELRASIGSAKLLFRGKKITGIFQPHLFTRTRDFAVEFAEALSLLDELWLLDIYPAREEPIQGIDSEMILNKVVIKNKKLVKREDLLQEAYFKNKNLQVLMTLGAGDIGELVNPLGKILEEVYIK